MQHALIDAYVDTLWALVIFDLQWVGDLIDSRVIGETQLNWLAVAMMIMLLFIVGLIVLCLFPPLMRALLRVA